MLMSSQRCVRLWEHPQAWDVLCYLPTASVGMGKFVWGWQAHHLMVMVEILSSCHRSIPVLVCLCANTPGIKCSWAMHALRRNNRASCCNTRLIRYIWDYHTINKTSVLVLPVFTSVCSVYNLVVGWKTLEYICNAIALWLVFPVYAAWRDLPLWITPQNYLQTQI